MSVNFLIAFFSCFAASAPSPPNPRYAVLPPKSSVTTLGNTTSNFPNIYRDGGGGGKINGLNFIMFSDGLYTSGGVPAADGSNVVNFSSNSIACSNCDGNGILSLSDFGTTTKGPYQQIPYFYDNGEDDSVTGIWPNQNIATLCDGICGVSFPQVVNRTAISANVDANLYNTGVQIDLTEYGPVVSRPVQGLFVDGEPMFGTFCTLVGADGYLYMFAHISQTITSNGLKVARVPQNSWSERSQYQYWNGKAWGTQIPVYNDGGAANIFNYSQAAINGINYGPGTGDIFYSNYYGVYMMLFQGDDAALDPNVYLTYSTGTDVTGPWTSPEPIYSITTISGGYSYSFHAYPNYDPTGKVIPLSWSQFGTPSTFLIGMANVTFS